MLIEFFVMVQQNLLIKQVFKLLCSKIVVLELKVKVIDFLSGWFVLLQMKVSHIRMFEGLLDSYSLFGVENQEFLQ